MPQLLTFMWFISICCFEIVPEAGADRTAPSGEVENRDVESL